MTITHEKDAAVPPAGPIQSEPGPKEPTEESCEDVHDNTSPKTKPKKTHGGLKSPSPTSFKKTFLDVILEEGKNHIPPQHVFPPVNKLRRLETVSDLVSGLVPDLASDGGLSLLPRARSVNLKRRNATHYIPPEDLPFNTGSPFVLRAPPHPRTCLEDTMLKPFALGWRRIDVVVDLLVIAIVVFSWPVWVALLMIGCFRGPKAMEYLDIKLV